MNTILCGKSKTPLLKFNSHSHPTWEIILMVSGKATSIIGDEKFEIEPGYITIVPPNTMHSNFSDEYYTDMFLQAHNLEFNDTIVTFDADQNVLTLMKMLHKVMAEKETNYSEIADNLTSTIVSYINKLSKRNHNYPFVDRLKNTIYENISNTNFDLTKEMSKLGYNLIYIRRCFKSVVGLPPLEYMTKLRINQAKILLYQNPLLSIKEIALACGFCDSLYFSTCFKKHIGISPREYRKNVSN